MMLILYSSFCRRRVKKSFWIFSWNAWYINIFLQPKWIEDIWCRNYNFPTCNFPGELECTIRGLHIVHQNVLCPVTKEKLCCISLWIVEWPRSGSSHIFNHNGIIFKHKYESCIFRQQNCYRRQSPALWLLCKWWQFAYHKQKLTNLQENDNISIPVLPIAVLLTLFRFE